MRNCKVYVGDKEILDEKGMCLRFEKVYSDAIFHQFGMKVYSGGEVGIGNETVCVVEFNNGTLKLIDVEKVVLLDEIINNDEFDFYKGKKNE